MGVFQTLITKALATALFLSVFAASYLECRAAVNPMPLSACCKKGPCPDTRGHSKHSSCQMQTSATERPALPEPPLRSARTVALTESQLPAEQVVPAVQTSALVLFTSDYPPPDLFLQNSSFLI